MIRLRYMKILVLNINQDTVLRGAEIFWENLKKQLEKRGVEVKIISKSKSVVQNKSQNLLFKILRRFYLDFYSISVLFFTLKNIVRIKKEKPDIVIPTNGGWQTVVVRLIQQTGLIDKGKIVIIGHAGIGHDEEFNLRFHGADLFIALTKEQEMWAENVNFNIKVQYIPNGVDTVMFTPEGERYDYKLEKPIFLTVASLEKYKNIEKTIEAVSSLGKGSLVILRSGEEDNNVKTLCDEKLKGKYFLSKINHRDLPKYYRGANVFTLVSGRQEAFGLVYLEALACGLPVVATNDAKRQKIIGDAGIFVDPNNLEEYKSALMKAVIVNWGEKPACQAEKFSWEKTGKQYFSVFTNLSNKKT